MKPEWSVLFLLPNLELDERDLRSPALTLGLDGIAIVPSEDERVHKVRQWSTAADRLLDSFHDEYGHRIRPAALIAREDWIAHFNRSAEPVVAFRNAVALSAALLNRARGREGSFYGTSWTDTFDFHPAQIARDGQRVDIFTPSVAHWAVPIEDLHSGVDAGLPRRDLGSPDELLALTFGRAWRETFLGRRRRAGTSLFRSLEIAYHAASVTFKNYGSLYEAGLGAILWVNAIEILASPSNRYVNRMDGVSLVGRFRWEQPELRARRFRVVKQRKKGKIVDSERVNVAQRLYDHMYTARSKFVHGDRITQRLLKPYPNRPHLLALASSVYRAAIGGFLDQHWRVAQSLAESVWFGAFAMVEYERHLMVASGKKL